MLEHEIVHLPSASTLAVLRRELASRLPAPKTAAVLADPVFEPTDLRVKRAQQRLASNTAKPQDDASLSQSQMTRSLDDTDLIRGGQLSIPRLPYSQSEAEVIKRLVPENMRKLALGFEVNHAAATDPELGNYAIIHFATH